jgi:hypothetical protein
LLSHHLACDEVGWALLHRLFERLKDHRAVRWLAASELCRMPPC